MTMTNFRASKRPSVKQVSKWYECYKNTIDLSWRGQGEVFAMIEHGYPFPDFYRVTYTVDGIKKSKLFYGETAHNDAERFVSDLGFVDCWGVL